MELVIIDESYYTSDVTLTALLITHEITVHHKEEFKISQLDNTLNFNVPIQKLPKKKAQWKQEMNRWKGKKL